MTEESTDIASIKMGEGPLLSSIFRRMPERFSEIVVNQALKFRNKVSDGARREINSAIGTSVRVNGFRNASKATPQQLAGPVLDRVGRDPYSRLSGAILRTWEESQAPLRDLVAEHLRAAGQGVPGLDYQSCRFNDTWDEDDWIQERKALFEGNRDSLSEDEVALMLCLVSGRMPAPDHLEEELPPIESGRFLKWLDELGDLSPQASDWGEAENFAEAVKGLAAKKEEEFTLARIAAFNAELDRLKKKFSQELRYLGLELGAWFDSALERKFDILSEASDLVEELGKQLSSYRPVRPQAEVLEEEKHRCKVRERCERAILKIVEKWDALMSRPRQQATPKVAQTRENYATGKAAAEETEAAEASGQKLEALQSELEQSKQAQESLQAENAGMQSDKEQLGKENRELKRQLAQSEEMGEHWRQAYVSEKGKFGREDGAEAPPELASVSDAIDQAKETFADELVFALNSKSRKNCPFQKPDEVFDALAWLATEFHRMRLNPGDNPDFNKSLKEACSGWFYKANQTEVTMSQFSDWYRTKVDGQPYELSNHIGKGTSFDPKSTIRIAFAWDEESQRVILGFIGLHQKNRSS